MNSFHRLIVIFTLVLMLPSISLRATSDYEYKPNEYVTIVHGVSPDGHYAIATHGGNNGFHVYLMNAQTGRKIGPLTEMTEFLDTAASAFIATWSADSKRVTIVWRRERHNGGMIITYRISNGRAYHIKEDQ